MALEKKMLGPKPGKEDLLIKTGSKQFMAGMKGGESRSGFLGKGNIVRKPDYEPEQDGNDAETIARKKSITNLLIGVIEPNPLSSKSTPEMDKRSLITKLKKSSLNELTRLLPERLQSLEAEQFNNPDLITDEDRVEIQNLYKEVSP